MSEYKSCPVCKYSVDVEQFIGGLSFCYDCLESLKARAYKDLASLPGVISAIGNERAPMSVLVNRRLEDAIGFLHMAESATGKWEYPRKESKGAE